MRDGLVRVLRKLQTLFGAIQAKETSMGAVSGSSVATGVGLRLGAAVTALALSVLSSTVPAWAEEDI